MRTLRQLRSLSDVPRRAYWARIKRILYAGTRADAAEIGFDDERIYRELARPLNERSLEMRQLLREEALDKFVTVQSGPEGLVYLVKAKDGKVLHENLSEEQLKAQAPDIHELIKTAVAGSGDNSFMDARLGR